MLIEALEKEKKALEREKRGVYKKAKREDKIEAARKMIAKGFDWSLIAELTGLSEDAIIMLKQEMEARRN